MLCSVSVETLPGGFLVSVGFHTYTTVVHVSTVRELAEFLKYLDDKKV